MKQGQKENEEEEEIEDERRVRDWVRGRVDAEAGT